MLALMLQATMVSLDQPNLVDTLEEELIDGVADANDLISLATAAGSNAV